MIKQPIEERWKIWQNCLYGDDRNSIITQIHKLLWDMAIYKLVIENRRQILEIFPENPPINIPFHQFLDRLFYESQAIIIRKILDKSNKIDGKKGIYSLYSLIYELRDYREELTREKYFSLRGMPYDIQATKFKRQEYLEVKSRKGEIFQIPKELNVDNIETSHKNFDILSKSDKETRTYKDLISEETIEIIEKKLERLKSITTHVNKCIVHSATPESREAIEELDPTIRLGETHKILCSTTDFFMNVLFDIKYEMLLLEPTELFLYWGIPNNGESDIDRLKKKIDSFRNDVQNWCSESVEDFLENPITPKK